MLKFIFKKGFKHMIITMFIPFILFILSFTVLINKYYYGAIIILIYIPIFMLLNIGNIKNRLLNILPITVSLLYLIVSLERNNFIDTLYVFYLTPLLSVLLKPKKHKVKYLTMFISLIILSLKYFFKLNIPFYVNFSQIVIITLVFNPPFIVNRLFNKNKVKSFT